MRRPASDAIGGTIIDLPRAAPVMFSAAELDAIQLPPLRFTVPGLLPEGLALLAGKPKSGKSFAALGIAVAVATGGRAFHAVPTEPGDVLYCALEDGRRRLKDRLVQIREGRPNPARLVFATDWKKIGDGCVEDLDAWLDDHPQARLVIIDTLSCVKPPSRGRASAYDQDAAALRPLLDLARRRPGLTILVLHHTRKQAADDVFDEISGTYGLSGVADTLLVLARTDAGARLLRRGRDVDELARVLAWTDAGWKLGGDAHVVAATEARQAILELLADAGEPLSARAIADALDASFGGTRRMLARMATKREIQRTQRGFYACPNGLNVSREEGGV